MKNENKNNEQILEEALDLWENGKSVSKILSLFPNQRKMLKEVFSTFTILDNEKNNISKPEELLDNVISQIVKENKNGINLKEKRIIEDIKIIKKNPIKQKRELLNDNNIKSNYIALEKKDKKITTEKNNIIHQDDKTKVEKLIVSKSLLVFNKKLFIELFAVLFIVIIIAVIFLILNSKTPSLVNDISDKLKLENEILKKEIDDLEKTNNTFIADEIDQIIERSNQSESIVLVDELDNFEKELAFELDSLLIEINNLEDSASLKVSAENLINSINSIVNKYVNFSNRINIKIQYLKISGKDVTKLESQSEKASENLQNIKDEIDKIEIEKINYKNLRENFIKKTEDNLRNIQSEYFQIIGEIKMMEN
ncbi:MAG: hypothetical protein P1P85_00240 [Patescibacteria group bacterium]|nr:hypothetical protein [Patescibacteria group bacterium]